MTPAPAEMYTTVSIGGGQAMDVRAERGKHIAETGKLKRMGREWFVPSSSGDGRYIVRPDPDLPTCTCPDFELRGMKCKHIFAVEYTVERERHADGTTTVTETLTVSATVQKKTTYPQQWRAYNAAQSVEKDRVQELLCDLCRGVPEPDRKPTRGQKPHTVRDSVFAMVYKVYSTFSSRRFSSDLREAHARGHLSRPVPGLKTVQFFENPAFTPLLKQLVHRSSLPLRAVETDFAIDSSGFGSNRFERWFDQKYGVTRQKCVWVKCHIACGVKTNVVTAVRILDKDAGDSPQFVPLLAETAGGFSVSEMSADKAYGSLENFEAVAGCGGQGYIAFKANATGAAGGHFEKAFHYFSFKREEYVRHYHKRSNVESTFSMIKRKFGDSVRSKTDAAMVNEVLCKLVAHNLCVLIQEEHELGIEPVFRPADPGQAGLIRIADG
ncbi:MAG: transposase [Isosphaera sp.]|nr:transposase [Isosphaera sp.]